MRKNSSIDIAAIKAGDSVAWTALVSEWGPMLRGSIIRIVRNRDVAEEIVQVTFMRAFRHRHAMRGQTAGELWNWLLTTAKRLALQEIRRRARQPQADNSGDPSDKGTQEKQIFRRVLCECLNSLPPQEKVIVVLHTIDGLSFEEVADRLRIPVGTAKSRWHHGIRALREALGGATR